MKLIKGSSRSVMEPLTEGFHLMATLLGAQRWALISVMPEGESVVEGVGGFPPGEIVEWEDLLEGCGRRTAGLDQPLEIPEGFPHASLAADLVLLRFPLPEGDDAVLAYFGAGVVGPERERAIGRFSSLITALIDEHGRAGSLEEDLVNTLVTFQMTAEKKDLYNQGHSEQVARYALRIGRTIGLSLEHRSNLHLAALLHDIGKIGIVETILNKSTPLTEEEHLIVALHPVIGENLLKSVPMLSGVAGAIRHHHERWDGKGYPDGLAGEAIPLAARILAIPEAYDAMVREAPYRKVKDREGALGELSAMAGTQFDPELVRIFLELPPLVP